MHPITKTDATLNLFCFVGLVLVDCSASSDTIAVLKQGVDMGCCVVMANKKPLTSTMVRPCYVFNNNY